VRLGRAAFISGAGLGIMHILALLCLLVLVSHLAQAGLLASDTGHIVYPLTPKPSARANRGGKSIDGTDEYHARHLTEIEYNVNIIRVVSCSYRRGRPCTMMLLAWNVLMILA
jgi:hypothetical protein